MPLIEQSTEDSHRELQERNAAANMPQMRAIIDRQTAKIARQAAELTAMEQALQAMKEQAAEKDGQIAELERRLNIYDYRTQNVITYLNSDNPTPAHRICARLEIQDARAGR